MYLKYVIRLSITVYYNKHGIGVDNVIWNWGCYCLGIPPVWKLYLSFVGNLGKQDQCIVLQNKFLQTSVLYFNGRKNKSSIITEKDKQDILDEYLSLIKEPVSKFLNSIIPGHLNALNK